MLWHGDGENLPARLQISHFDFRHAATGNAFDRRRHSARVQPTGGGGDPEGVLCEPENAKPASRLMIIAQISDTHIALDTADAEQRIGDFERTIADINALDPAPDLIVHTGDIVQSGRADEYAKAAAILAQAHRPVYVLAGNKDDRVNLRTAFAAKGYLDAYSGFIDYAIEDYPVRLIAVDTLNTHSNKGDFCAERAQRLIAMIDAEPSKPIAV